MRLKFSRVSLAKLYVFKGKINSTSLRLWIVRVVRVYLYSELSILFRRFKRLVFIRYIIFFSSSQTNALLLYDDVSDQR